MTYKIFIGWDSREPVASYVAGHSIVRRTKSDVDIKYLRHRELRRDGFFNRPWRIREHDGEFIDERDGRPFSTEFSHTRFLIPVLCNYKGWALFFDADMIFLNDVKKLFDLCDDRYAVMCVKHKHQVRENSIKMDHRLQQNYYRKNWSSFVMWNCEHPSNKYIKPEYVNHAAGSYMHAFEWLKDEEIGELPFSYNYISGVSPPMPIGNKGQPLLPNVIHYTEGGPWFENIDHGTIKYGEYWNYEYEDWQKNGDAIPTSVPTTKFEV